MKSYKEFLNESIEDAGIFHAAFIGGLPGSGKSYTRKQINDGKISPRIVNTDKFFEFLSQQNDIEIENPPRWLVDQSKSLSKKQLTQFINSMLPLFIDGTSANASNLLKRVGILEGFGYDASTMVWVNTSLETAIERAQGRTERSVDEDFIERTFEKLSANKEFYKKKFSNFIEINNDVGELTDEVILNAYKQVSSYFHSDIENPIGNQNIEELREQGAKYLSPTLYSMSEISRSLDIWYKRK